MTEFKKGDIVIADGYPQRVFRITGVASYYVDDGRCVDTVDAEDVVLATAEDVAKFRGKALKNAQFDLDCAKKRLLAAQEAVDRLNSGSN